MKTGRLFSSLALVAGILLLASCSKNSSYPSATVTQGSGTPPPPNTVLISNFAFNPQAITVAKGTTVTWKNEDAATHTATADAGQWDTHSIIGGASGSITFNTPGTFTYHCTQHPMMTGSVTVQ